MVGEMDGRSFGWTDGQMDGWPDGLSQIDGRRDGWTDGLMERRGVGGTESVGETERRTSKTNKILEG